MHEGSIGERVEHQAPDHRGNARPELPLVAAIANRLGAVVWIVPKAPLGESAYAGCGRRRGGEHVAGSEESASAIRLAVVPRRQGDRQAPAFDQIDRRWRWRSSTARHPKGTVAALEDPAWRGVPARGGAASASLTVCIGSLQ